MGQMPVLEAGPMFLFLGTNLEVIINVLKNKSFLQCIQIKLLDVSHSYEELCNLAVTF